MKSTNGQFIRHVLDAIADKIMADDPDSADAKSIKAIADIVSKDGKAGLRSLMYLASAVLTLDKKAMGITRDHAIPHFREMFGKVFKMTFTDDTTIDDIVAAMYGRDSGPAPEHANQQMPKWKWEK